MRRELMFALVSVLLSAGIAAAAAAKPEKKTPEVAAPPAIEAKATDILKASSARLAAAKTMSFTAMVSYESPSRLGPALVYSTKSEVTMQRPNKLKVITLGDGPASEFYYDGKLMIGAAGMLTFAWSTGVLFTLAQAFQNRQIESYWQRRRKASIDTER